MGLNLIIHVPTGKIKGCACYVPVVVGHTGKGSDRRPVYEGRCMHGVTAEHPQGCPLRNTCNLRNPDGAGVKLVLPRPDYPANTVDTIEAARRLGVGGQTVYNRIHAGTLPAKKYGLCWRIKEEHLPTKED